MTTIEKAKHRLQSVFFYKFCLSAIQTKFGYHRACTISSRSDITAAGDIIYLSTRVI